MRYRVQHLPHRGVAIYRLQHVDGGSANLRVAVVEQSFQNGVPHSDVFPYVRLQTFQRFQAHANIPVVAQRHQQRIADAGSCAAMARTALGGQQLHRIVVHIIRRSIGRRQH